MVWVKWVKPDNLLLHSKTYSHSNPVPPVPTFQWARPLLTLSAASHTFSMTISPHDMALGAKRAARCSHVLAISPHDMALSQKRAARFCRAVLSVFKYVIRIREDAVDSFLEVLERAVTTKIEIQKHPQLIFVFPWR